MGSTIVRVGSSIFGYRPKKTDGSDAWKKKTLQRIDDYGGIWFTNAQHKLFLVN